MTVEYDPFASETKEDPYPSYVAMRAEAPVYRMDDPPGFFFVTRFEDVSNVLKSPEDFSSQAMQRMMMSSMGGGISGMAAQGPPDPAALGALAEVFKGLSFNPLEMMQTPSVISSDPPNHGRLRGIVNRGFTPRHISALEGRVREIASEALDTMLEKDEFDLVADFTVPLPVRVIAELLGVESDRYGDFKRWSDIIVSRTSGASGLPPAELLQTFSDFNEYFMEVIKRRRAEPKDDLISKLVAAEGGDAALSPLETLMFTVLLLVAGNETTTNLIGNATLALLRNPEQLELVRKKPERIPAMIEEALRYDSPVQMLFRETTRDVELAGTKIPQGSVVLPVFASANRDDAQFPDACRFDINRDTRGHVAFGFGIHFCLGASLARLEAKVGFEELFKRVRGLELLDEQPKHIDSFLLRGPQHLPLTQSDWA